MRKPIACLSRPRTCETLQVAPLLVDNPSILTLCVDRRGTSGVGVPSGSVTVVKVRKR